MTLRTNCSLNQDYCFINVDSILVSIYATSGTRMNFKQNINYSLMLLAYWATVTENIPRCAQWIESVQGTQCDSKICQRCYDIRDASFKRLYFLGIQTFTKKTNTVYTMCVLLCDNTVYTMCVLLYYNTV